MKKIMILLLILFCCGCGREVQYKNKEEEKLNIQKEEVYTDLNNTPISFYEANGSTLSKIHKVDAKLQVEKDIGVFQIFPSNEEQITLNESYHDAFLQEWNQYNTNHNLHIGFKLSFQVQSQDVSFTIINVPDTMMKWEYFMTYLYDDVANFGKGFYSHIEENDVNTDTLFTSLKIQSSYQVSEVNSPIEVMVFTYDGEDDFINGEYQGKSFSSFIICPEGISC